MIVDRRVEELVLLKKSNIDSLILRKWYDVYGRLTSLSLLGITGSNERLVEFMYASHKEEALEQLDELIDKLSAIRQDLDKTEV